MFMVRRLIVAMISVFPKVIYRFAAISPYQKPTGFFVDIDKVILKVIQKCKHTQNLKYQFAFALGIGA